VHQVGFM